jgi:predicted nucleic acid-binding protein
LVLDANILLRAVFGVRARGILESFEDVAAFYSPDVCFEDARKYIPVIAKRRGFDAAVGLAMLEEIGRIVEAVDRSLYEDFEEMARGRIASRDPEDWPVVATALMLAAPVWTEDRDFFGSGVATWTSDKVELYLRDSKARRFRIESCCRLRGRRLRFVVSHSCNRRNRGDGASSQPGKLERLIYFSKRTMVVEMPQNRSAYMATVDVFRSADPQSILGSLAESQTGDLTPAQRDAWLIQIKILKEALADVASGKVFFEFLIPRMGKRADNVLLVGGLVIVIEFKVGAETYDRAAKDQAIDYALDLKNFHAGSHHVPILPVLVATEAPAWPIVIGEPLDGVYSIALANVRTLGNVIKTAIKACNLTEFDHGAWLTAGYHPTPTIVEASQVLYRGHGVADITRMEAGAENLGATTDTLQAIIEKTRADGTKAICFVTGVPGAGKTLAGLNLVCLRRKKENNSEENAVFLSGNGPLVNVLREALARDEVARARLEGRTCTKKNASREVNAFIQNIHHFRDDCLMDPKPPDERVVLFDEAQRAWDRRQTSGFMKKKRGMLDFDQSEPSFLIGVMDRHPTWAVIVCLVGNGQEINTGEAGIEEWLVALRDRYPTWQIYMPDVKTAATFLPSFCLDELGARVTHESTLHLSVSLRSFRAERLSDGMAALLSGHKDTAQEELKAIQARYPILVTRSVEEAKKWIRDKARGSERTGLLASSGARRLKPLGITMEVQIDPCMWFLNGDDDVRSSYYLEDAASEFDVQGLELDWAIVVWDGDMIYQPGKEWRFRTFSGTKWQEIHNPAARRYRLNAYRVLLTRARQGIVIVVPEGDAADPTRDPAFYNPTWNYLVSVGLPLVPKAQRALLFREAPASFNL